MNKKTFFVTNHGEGSITVTGRYGVHIPGLCNDLPLSFPECAARQIISRLKQRYPLLKFSEAPAEPQTATAIKEQGKASGGEFGKAASQSEASPLSDASTDIGGNIDTQSETESGAISISASKKKSK